MPALRYRDLRFFCISLVAAHFGSQLQTTANLWQVFVLTGSPLHLGGIGLARAIPTLTLTLAGGVVADRIDRVRFIQITQAAGGLVAVALAALTAWGHVEVWHIYLATFCTSTITSFGSPARTSVTPTLVPREHLMNALSINQTIMQTSRIFGPALAGVSIAAIGLVPTYLANGLGQLCSLTTLAVLRVRPGGMSEVRRPEPPWRSFLEGLAFVRLNSVILILLAMDLAMSSLGSYRALLPIFADRSGFGVQGLGLLQSAPAIGSLIGAAVLMSFGNIRYKGLLAAGMILCYCGALLLLASAPWFGLSMFAAALLGFFDATQTISRTTVIQSLTPDALRGRVAAFQHMLTGGGPAVGEAMSGAIASAIGPPLALTLGAFSCVAVIFGIASMRPDLRDPALGDRTIEPEPGTSTSGAAAAQLAEGV